MTAQELRQKRASLIDESTGIFEAISKENRAFTSDERERLSAIEDEIRTLDTDIGLAERHEQRAADLRRTQGRRSEPQTAEPGDGGTQEARDEALAAEDVAFLSPDEQRARQVTLRRRGRVIGRMIRALAAGKGDPDRAAAFSERQFGKDDPATRALAATDFTAGGAIVPDEYAASIIELLRPQSVVRRMNPTIVPMGTGTLRIPKLAGGAIAGYIGENEDAPKTEQSFGALTLTFRKLAALVPVGNDLLRYATPNADTIVRDDTTASLAQRSDLAFIRGQGSAHSPKGLRYWARAANVIPANNTVNLANVTVDLGKLWLALANGNVRFLRPGYLMSPRSWNYLATVRDGNGNFAFRDELSRGMLNGFPVAFTTQIPDNLGGGSDESEVYLVDFADAVIGEAVNLLIDVSTEAAYYDGSQVVSAFGKDQTVVRAISEHDFGMRHDESVAVLTGVTWGAS